MSIYFEFYEDPDPTNEKQEKYHARTVITQRVTTKQICREIQHASSLTMSDVKAALVALSNCLASHMSESHSVHLEGIGYFKPTLQVSREIDPQKTRAQSVWFKSVAYKPDKELYYQLANTLTERSPIKIHSAKLTSEQVDKKVKEYLATHDFMTRKQLERLCKLTKSTALRHIKRMVAEGKIKNKGMARQPLYVWG